MRFFEPPIGFPVALLEVLLVEIVAMKLEVALFALEALVVEVPPNVVPQITCGREALIAVLAHVGLLACVRLQVVYVASPVFHLAKAVRTLVLLQTASRWHVSVLDNLLDELVFRR